MIPPIGSKSQRARQRAWCEVLLEQPWLTANERVLVKRLASQFGSDILFNISTERQATLMDLVGKASAMGVAFRTD